MAESKLTIEERHAGDVTVLVLTGQMLLDDGDLAFGKRISDLIDRGCAKIVLDLGGVSYIDSSGVGMIVFQLKTLQQKGGDMKLLHLNPRAESLFGMLKLLMMFDRFEDEAAAVRSFGWAADRDRRAGPSG
jgi:anti-sigma B factor antagonist